MKVSEIYTFLDTIAPFNLQKSYDNSGVLIGEKNAEIRRICVCLDITLDVIDEAKKQGANLIISHNPVIFNPLKGILGHSPVSELIRNEINAISAHTNFDAVIMGDLMLGLLGLKSTDEILDDGSLKTAELPSEITAEELAKKCKVAFDSPVVKYVAGSDNLIGKLAVCAGSGGSVLDTVIENNCDAFITGEVKHSDFVKAKNSGLTLIEAGHFHTEKIFCDFIKSKLAQNFADLPVFISEFSADFCEYVK